MIKIKLIGYNKDVVLGEGTVKKESHPESISKKVEFLVIPRVGEQIALDEETNKSWQIITDIVNFPGERTIEAHFAAEGDFLQHCVEADGWVNET